MTTTTPFKAAYDSSMTLLDLTYLSLKESLLVVSSKGVKSFGSTNERRDLPK